MSRHHPLFILLAIALIALAGCGDGDEAYEIHPDDRWNPEEPAAWFTADHGDSLHTSDDAVERWDDLAGNFDAVNELGQTNPTLDEVDGRPSVYFNEDGLQLSEAEDIFRNREQFAVLAIYQPDSNQETASLIFFNSLPESRGLRRATLGFRSDEHGVVLAGRRQDSDSIVRIYSDEAPSLGQPLAQVNEFDHTANRARIVLNDGTPTVEAPFLGSGPTSDTASLGTFIGTTADDGRRIGDVHLHELVVYQRLPSQDEIDAFFDHARDHWDVDL